MTSNFPGTVDAQHGLKTDKHDEPRVEDERPARAGKLKSLQVKLSPVTYNHPWERHTVTAGWWSLC